MKQLKSVLLAASLLACSASFAQEKPTLTERLTKDLSVTGSAGLMHFYGDIRQYDFYPVWSFENENQLGFGLSLNKGLSNTISLQFSGNYGRLQGVRRGKRVGDLYPRGMYFNTNVLEGSVRFALNLNNIISPYRERFDKKWAIYTFGGYGLMRFNSTIYKLHEENGQAVEIDQKRGKGRTGETVEAVGTIGMAFKYHLNKNMDLGLESSYRFVNSDRLDGWEVFGSAKDRYSYTALTFTYHFGVKDGEQPRERTGPMDSLLDRIEKLESGGVSSTVAPVATPAGPVDVDQDGVADDADEEIFSPQGSSVNDKGVAPDADGDGVPDKIDIEPNTPAGAMVNFKGQEIKAGEKVIERIIEKQVGGGSSTGDPATQPTRADLKNLNQMENVYFDSNRDEIRGDQMAKLDALASKMKKNNGLRVKLVGVADFYGTEPYNMDLSQRRARSAKDYLVNKHNISASRIEVDGKGEIASPPSEASKNRRVDIYELK